MLGKEKKNGKKFNEHTKQIEQKFQVEDLVTAQTARLAAQMTTIQGYSCQHEQNKLQKSFGKRETLYNLKK